MAITTFKKKNEAVPLSIYSFMPNEVSMPDIFKNE